MAWMRVSLPSNERQRDRVILLYWCPHTQRLIGRLDGTWKSGWALPTEYYRWNLENQGGE